MNALQHLENFLQALTSGLLTGADYGLMCVGLSLIFGVMRVINFAQGDFMMLGMYAAFYAVGGLGLTALLGEGAGPYVAAILAGPAVFVLGYVVHGLLVGRVTGVAGGRLEGEGHHAQLVLTLGLALLLQNGALILFGSSPAGISTSLSYSAWIIGPMVGEWVTLFINQAQTVSAGLAVLVMLLFTVLMARTRFGKALRAAADNPHAALYMGIDVDRAYRLAFALGVAITAVAGGLLALNTSFQPYVGTDYVIAMYAGVVLGGLGSVGGAFMGGLTIGLVQQLSTLVLPAQLQNMAVFVLFLLVILFRPQGFFGRAGRQA
jgi:branched-chain amino acid transport system permease protein